LFFFLQLSAAIAHHKANDGVVGAIWAWVSTIPHCLQWYCTAYSLNHSSTVASST